MLENFMCNLDLMGFKFLVVCLEDRLFQHMAVSHPKRTFCLFNPLARDSEEAIDFARPGSFGSPVFNAVACAKLEVRGHCVFDWGR